MNKKYYSDGKFYNWHRSLLV